MSEEVFISGLNRPVIVAFPKEQELTKQITFSLLHFQRYCLIQPNEGQKYVRPVP